jgi:MoxR-like ATPase
MSEVKFSNDSSIATLSDAQNYFDAGMIELDKILVAEGEAKKLLLVSSIAGGAGEAVLLGGDPGGSKTKLMRNFFKLFKDLEDKEIVGIPVDKDLSPVQIAGARINSPIRVTDKDGNVVRDETEIRDIVGKIKPSTKVILFDEMNRIDPFALNFLLEGIEEGQLTTVAETVILGLTMVISTMNGSDISHSNYPISQANASRHARGIVLGANSADNPKAKADRGSIVRSGYKGMKSGKIEGIISLDNLERIRRYATTISTSDALLDKAESLIIKTNSVLRDFRIPEADGRMAGQIGNGARAFAAAKGETSVSEESIKQSVRSTLTARLVARSRFDGQKIKEEVDRVIPL